MVTHKKIWLAVIETTPDLKVRDTEISCGLIFLEW